MSMFESVSVCVSPCVCPCVCMYMCIRSKVKFIQEKRTMLGREASAICKERREEGSHKGEGGNLPGEVEEA